MPKPFAKSIPIPFMVEMLFLIILIPFPVILIPESELLIIFEEMSVESAIDSKPKVTGAEFIEDRRIIFDLMTHFLALIFIPVIEVPPPVLAAPLALKIKSFPSDIRLLELVSVIKPVTIANPLNPVSEIEF